MTPNDWRGSIAGTIVKSALVGIVAALVSMVVLRLIGVDLSSGAMGGIVGAVAGATVVRRKRYR
jgi:uncharacterized membrane protein YeaQ/YmgE (transglycosylase-associated protein family)